MLTRQTNLYETLEISPDASPHEVREAYLRMKAAYNRDSVALYTLIGADEREDIIKSIEDAYQTLSNPDRRKLYDRCHESVTTSVGFPGDATPISAPTSIASIDRTPPMETKGSTEQMLIPPSTDFVSPDSKPPGSDIGWSYASDHESNAKPAATANQAPTAQISSGFNLSAATAPTLASPNSVKPVSDSGNVPALGLAASSDSARPVSSTVGTVGAAGGSGAYPLELQEEIQNQTEWSGEFIRKLRNARQISIEEIANITKISRTNLNAIESEDFKKLPAAVFARGFVMQIARLLKLNPETQNAMISSYMTRYFAQRPDQKR